MARPVYFKSLYNIACRQLCTNRGVRLMNTTVSILPLNELKRNESIVNDFSKLNFIQRRTAKKAIVKEAKGKHAKPKVHLSEDEMMQVIEVDSLKEELELVLERLKKVYAENLLLRTASGSIENIEVDIENEKYPLNQIAQIFRKSSQLMVVNMVTFPEAIKPTLQAIQNSGMNLSPQQDGTVIYIPLPKVTKEHRENLAKNAKAAFNKAKDEIRNIQNKYTREAKKQTDLSEDLVFNCQQQIKSMAEEISAQGEKLMQNKQKELLAEQ